MLGQGMLLLGTPLALLGSFHARRQHSDEPLDGSQDGEEPPTSDR